MVCSHLRQLVYNMYSLDVCRQGFAHFEALSCFLLPLFFQTQHSVCFRKSTSFNQNFSLRVFPQPFELQQIAVL